VAITAPKRARKSPYTVCFPRSQSPQPIISPPATATRTEKNRGNEKRSGGKEPTPGRQKSGLW